MAGAVAARDRVEAQMAMVTGGGWRSWEALQNALLSLDPPQELIEEDGAYYREVPVHIGPDGTYMQDGRLVHERHWKRRPVALSRAAALESLQSGVEADFFDGYTWWRRGQKPERDIHLAAIQAAERPARIDYEDASPTDQAQFQAITVQAQARKPVVPVKGKTND